MAKSMTDLLAECIQSDAIAHIYDDAAFNPPPKRSTIEDSQTSCTGKTFGNAPKVFIKIRHFPRRTEDKRTNGKYLTQRSSNAYEGHC
jgi:hypothetical protein